MTKDTLKSSLAAGKTRQVMESLLMRTQGDRDLHTEAVALSARYQHYLREKNGGRAEPAWLDMELNKINAAALGLIELFPERAVFAKKMNWEKVALWLGIFAAIAGITGYTLWDYSKKPEPVPIVAPKVEPPVQNSAEMPKSQPSTAQPALKNQTNIYLKDKAKVGIISTGDSAVFKDIKQDF